jgi:hypothetical protein
VNVTLNAPEVGDFWVANSPNRIGGPLQLAGQVQWKQQIANGQMWVFGSDLRMRDLVLRQLSTQCAISNSVIYLNDCSATLNDTDFINATGRLNLQRPYHYSGKVSVSVANLATLQPLLRAAGNQNELAGSITLNWEGEGQGVTASQPSSSKSTAVQAVAPCVQGEKVRLIWNQCDLHWIARSSANRE